jgi:hypothetical protein
LSRYRDFNDRAGNLNEGETPFSAEPIVGTIEGLTYDRGELLKIRADISAAERFGKPARSVAPSPAFVAASAWLFPSSRLAAPCFHLTGRTPNARSRRQGRIYVRRSRSVAPGLPEFQHRLPRIGRLARIRAQPCSAARAELRGA